jgi:methionyl-tRNA formyltransferase
MPRPIIAFMGTPEFAVPSLAACVALGDVALVVTRADRPRGRGQQVTPSPVKVWAESKGIPVAQPEKLKGADFDRELAKVRPDVVVVAAYGKILPPEVLAVPKAGSVNVHASLLPRHRGAAPIQWAIIQGDPSTGISLMKMEAGLDTGPVFAQRSIPITSEDTGGSLTGKLSSIGAEILRAELLRFLEGAAPLVQQDDSKASLAPAIRKQDALLDFTRPASELEHRIRAFDPVPGAVASIGDQPHKIWRARVVPHAARPGVIVRVEPGALWFGTGAEALEILELTPPGRRRMTAAEFVAGHRLAVGSILQGSR